MTVQTISITKAQLQQALHEWEADYRAGKTMTPEDAAKLSVDEVAQGGADRLWPALGGEAQ